ncbi:MAG TPA: phosphoribosyltransferase [Thermoanaerobaculia bacterium]|nr:phosphoribosyltransferase [Thermoanaerobaculia bacterium]
MIVFANRSGAGRQLADRLMHLSGRDDVLVLALPRGGVPVGYSIAERLGVPLDVFVVRKIGVPGQDELALGAIATGEAVVYNEELLSRLHLPPAAVQFAIGRSRIELSRREKTYRGEKPPVDVGGKTVLVVDDGLATGSTMRAAVQALRRRSAKRIIVAVPVGSEDAVHLVRAEADEVLCLSSPPDFRAVSLWYVDFPQITDEEVRALLSQSVERASALSHASA